jgi:hypothetical protein
MKNKNCKKVITDLKTNLDQLKSELENVSQMFVEISKSLNKIIEIGNNNECFSDMLKEKLNSLIRNLNNVYLKEDEYINVNKSIDLINDILKELE